MNNVDVKQKIYVLVCFFLVLGVVFPSFCADFYWEMPQTISSADSRFPSSAQTENLTAVIWQDINARNKTINLSARVHQNGVWSNYPNFAGPFPYSGDVPVISSVAINKNGLLVVSALSDISTISVFTSSNGGKSFLEQKIQNPAGGIVAPRIFALSDGSFILFASQGEEESFVLVHSRSVDGSSWTPFEPFEPARGLPRAFVPAVSPVESGDLVVFQAAYESGYRSSYQLYTAFSADGARTWTAPRLVTDFNLPQNERLFTDFHNERPSIRVIANKAYLVWERTPVSSLQAVIFFMPLTHDGKPLDVPVQVSHNTNGNANQPLLVEYRGEPAVVWFDDRRGQQTVYLALYSGLYWEENRLSVSNTDSIFSSPLLINGELYLIWQQNQSNGTGRVIQLAPDSSVGLPSIRPLNFMEGKRSSLRTARFQISFPQDSSGIAGYSYSWSQDAAVEPPKVIMKLLGEPRMELSAENDGSWYFKVRIVDYAGNWSAPASTLFFRDTTPPASPAVNYPEQDRKGFIKLNTFSIAWQPPLDDDVSGYTYSLEYMAPVSRVGFPAELSEDFDAEHFLMEFAAALGLKPARPPARIVTNRTAASYTNRDNGLYAFSVSAIDSVGNVSQPAVTWLLLNKYVPYTIISSIRAQTDDAGTVSMSIIGRGYTADGNITEMYLDRDGSPPYDRILLAANDDYTVLSDRQITGIRVSDLEEGTYRVGLVHSTRGLYFSAPLVRVDSYGTVKFGNYAQTGIVPVTLVPQSNTPFVRLSDIAVLVLCLFTLLGILVSFRGISHTAQETLQVRREVYSLLTGDIMPSEKKVKTAKLKQRGVSLKYKLMSFTAVLVLFIIILVSVPLGYYMSVSQESIIAQGLESQVRVLLESLSSGVRAYMPSKNVLELGYLPQQSTALPEARNATITGLPSSGDSVNLDYVWATNDTDIMTKIDTPVLTLGFSRLDDELSAQLAPKIETLNQQAVAAVGELASQIDQLTREAVTLVLRSDTASVQRRDEIQTIISRLNETVTGELNTLSNSSVGSWPEYNNKQLSRTQTTYVFYKPVLYRQTADANFVHALVRVEVSTEALLKTLLAARNNIVFITLVIAFFAVTAGIVGSLILASVIIQPIRRLAVHVALIRDTEDKEKLDGKDIAIKSKDEIALLGEIVNDMTHGLVKAAAASKDLTVGKEVQKMFIPLEVDKDGKKLTTGKLITDDAEFFGYYEGAKGVSGDYFDFQKLDDRHYAVIKCDVAGKGVPASLIMVEVATLFLDYFKDWSFKKNGYNLSPFVSRVNDLIESRGFKGRFAAFSLCILDSRSGDIHFCNAGDNLLHFYNAAKKCKVTEKIHESSAAGVFPSFMVDMKGGFKMVKKHLAKGDVLFMYTDGIEEAKRMFRDKNLKGIVCDVPGLEQDAPHESHSVGQESEEMGPERVNEIIEAVFDRSTYCLIKWHNPIENELFDFDFTTCNGTVEDCILALVSVEKIFRLYKDPKATEYDRVLVDRKVDDFLNLHFKQYGDYCSNRRDHSDSPEYVWYTHIKEDPQYDDLTLLGIKKL